MPGDVGVLRGKPFGGVEDEDRHLAPFQPFERHDHGQLLQRLAHPPLAPDPGSVDENVRTTAVQQLGVHGVPCRAGG
jgi:hypothetical protein